MGKIKKATNSYDYILDSINGCNNFFKLVDFNIDKIFEEKVAAEYFGTTPSQRRLFYDGKVFPFLKSFDPEKFLKGFSKPTDKKRLEFLEEPANSKDLQYIVWLAEHSERIITDIKTVKADFKAAGFTTREDMENEIRVQAKLYKPFLEILKCMADIDRYKKGDQPFEQTKLKGFEKQKKGYYTDEMVGVDVEISDQFDALKRKNKIYENLFQEGNTKLVSEKKNNKIIEEYASQAEQGIKYIRQHQRIKALDPEAGFDIDKDAFQKDHLNKLCAAIKETDPIHVLSNTKEFKKMRDFLYSFTKNYDKLNPQQRQLAGKELKKLTKNYITPRVKRYEKEMNRFSPIEPEYMNERSRTRFELAQKLNVLCDIVSADYAPLPKHAELSNPERFKHFSKDTVSRVKFEHNRLTISLDEKKDGIIYPHNHRGDKTEPENQNENLNPKEETVKSLL